MEINHYQYWILDTAAKFAADVFGDLTPFLLDAEQYTAVQITVPRLEATAQEMAGLMLSLFEAGYITWTTALDDDLDSTSCPSYEEVLRAFTGKCGEDDFRAYQLTALGGQVWEAYSKPNWDYFIRQGDYYLDRDTCFRQIRCSSKAILERLLISAEVVPSYEAYSVSSWSRPLIPGTVTWTTLGEWHPTYWKTLKHGFQVRYQVIPNPEIEYTEDKVMTQEEKADYLFPLYLAEHWYTPYFDISQP